MDQLPTHVPQTPVRIGPLTLLGLHVHPECLSMNSRRMIWVESYWTAESPLEEDYLLDITAVPLVEYIPPYGQGMWHDPCDWMWPTSRWTPGIIHKDVSGLRPPAADRLRSTELVLRCAILKQKAILAEYSLPGRLSLTIGKVPPPPA